MEHSGDGSGQQTLTLLIDDVRRFKDGRVCRIARTSTEGVGLLLEHRHVRIDDLWLDFDLLNGDNVWPVVRLLEDEALAGRPFDIGVIHVQAASAGRAHEMTISLQRAGGYVVQRSTDLRMWTHGFRSCGRRSACSSSRAGAERPQDHPGPSRSPR